MTSTTGDLASTDPQLLKVQLKSTVTVLQFQQQECLEFQVMVLLSVPSERNCVRSIETTRAMICSVTRQTIQHLPVVLIGLMKKDHKDRLLRPRRTVVHRLDLRATQH